MFRMSTEGFCFFRLHTWLSAKRMRGFFVLMSSVLMVIGLQVFESRGANPINPKKEYLLVAKDEIHEMKVLQERQVMKVIQELQERQEMTHMGYFMSDSVTDSLTDSLADSVASSSDDGARSNGVERNALGKDRDTEIVEVTNPKTGLIWMDRNLGASRVAERFDDEVAYGDLYQWGRLADGHQKRTSGKTGKLSASDRPGHGDFILSYAAPYDWRLPQNDELWQGVDGVNNPCPTGYRLPTNAEWELERKSWKSNTREGAFGSPLKLPAAGFHLSSGLMHYVGSRGGYWTSTVSGKEARYLYFGNSTARMSDYRRANAVSVRCLKDEG